jgi:hypothetical protein
MQTKNTKKSAFTKEVSKIKIDKKLDNLKDAPFFKKKLEKANRILSSSSLPSYSISAE